MTVLLPLSFSSWLLAGLSHSGLYTNVYISEDLCRTSEAGSPNPRGSVEHRLRTTVLKPKHCFYKLPCTLQTAILTKLLLLHNWGYMATACPRYSQCPYNPSALAIFPLYG